jgi:HK97 family phage prohead protease
MEVKSLSRAYSVLSVKAVEEDQRVIRGVATTPTPDRVGDIVEPLGVEFKNPLPLLWQHQASKPVGFVKFDKPTKDGITFEAKIERTEEPGTLKDRLDEAWLSVKMGLVRAVSIGFRSLEEAYDREKGGWHFLRTEVMELSLVTIPANSDATITLVKQFDIGAPEDAADKPIPQDPAPAATGPKVRVVKLNNRSRVRETPFVIRKINRVT